MNEPYSVAIKYFLEGEVTNIEYGKIDFENVNIETVTSTQR